MIPGLFDSAASLPWFTVETTITTIVSAVIVSRLYFGSVVFAPRYAVVWNIARRILAPIIQRVIYQTAIPNVEIENEATREEYVGVVDLTGKELALRIDGHRDVEIPLLAGFKTDWDGNVESGTFVWYCGFPPMGLPNWLSPYQVHCTYFRIGGRTRLTAHFEANPWRPDLWADHLFKGDSFSVPKGVQRAKRALSDAEVPLSAATLEG